MIKGNTVHPSAGLQGNEMEPFADESAHVAIDSRHTGEWNLMGYFYRKKKNPFYILVGSQFGIKSTRISFVHSPLARSLRVSRGLKHDPENFVLKNIWFQFLLYIYPHHQQQQQHTYTYIQFLFFSFKIIFDIRLCVLLQTNKKKEVGRHYFKKLSKRIRKFFSLI